MMNLYFCNGWHRPGGKHPISFSERDKVLQILFPNTPELANGDATAPRQREPRAPSFPEISLSERYGSTFSTVPSAGQHGRQTLQTPATNLEQGQRAPPVANESQESASISLSESERFVFTNAESGAELFEHVPFTTRPNARVLRRSARLRGQQPEADRSTASSSQATLAASSPRSAPLRRSARIRGQGQHSEGADAPAAQIPAAARAPAPQSNPTNRQNESDHTQPTHSSPSAPIAREHRMARNVDATEDCGICREQLGAGSDVGRCCTCGNDFHKICWATWLTTGSQTCGSW